MGLFDFFKSHGKKGPVQDEEAQREPIGLEVYSHMRVEVTTPEGELIFVAKLVNLRERTAELQQFSESALSQETEESEEPIPVHIRGYNDHERKAVYLEGLITPKPKHIWQVEQLVLVKVENARAFFRLDTNLDATVTTFSGLNIGEKPCKLLNISNSTLRNLRAERAIPFYKLGGTFLYSKEEIMNYLASNYSRRI